MKTHTVKLNKRKSIQIIKFENPFLNLMKRSNWWASGLICYYIKSKVKELSGKDTLIDSEQLQELNDHFNYPITSKFTYNQHMIEKWVTDSFLNDNISLEELLDILNDLWLNYLNKQKETLNAKSTTN